MKYLTKAVYNKALIAAPVIVHDHYCLGAHYLFLPT